MTKGVRIFIMFALIFFIGALQYVVPLFESQAKDSDLLSTTRINFSYESTPGESATNSHKAIWVSDYQDVEQGSLFFKEQSSQGLLLSPLLDTQVSMRVSGMVARATVTQTFRNTSSNWVNGIYVFPLPETAAVDHLWMKIGKRTIEGQIQPKQKARAIYEQAKSAGKKASLLEQQRPNVFTNSIANIGPGEMVTVKIEYQQRVHFDKNEFSIRLPTTVAKRFLPQRPQQQATIGDSGWSFQQPLHLPPVSPQLTTEDDDGAWSAPRFRNPIAIDVRLDSGFAIQNISSSSHSILVEQQQGSHLISLASSDVANRDFVLSWQASEGATPTAAHFYQQRQDGYYGMVMLLPPANHSNEQNLPREVVFVLDTSGSMQGESMVQAQQALQLAIEDLNEGDRFNVIEFDSSARRLWRTAQVATPQNKDNAIDYVYQLKADGGTQMLSALQLALAQQSKDRETPLRQVIFITDGAVGNELQLFDYIKHNLQDSRLFTVGIGSAPNGFFMSEAAKMGKGTFTYINAADQVQLQMASLFRKLHNPVLTDLLARFSSKVEFYPQKLPDLYSGEPIVLSYRSDQAVEELSVSGSLKRGYWSQEMKLESGAPGTGLNVLWARTKIADLERSKRMGADLPSTNEQIEKVAMTHHLVSSQTSLVAVDTTPTATNNSIDTEVASLAPKGADMVGVLPQTATASELFAYLGWLFIGLGLCSTFILRVR